MTFSAVLTVRCNLFLSCLVADPNQTVTDMQRTDWMIAEYNWISSSTSQVELPELAQEVEGDVLQASPH